MDQSDWPYVGIPVRASISGVPVPGTVGRDLSGAIGMYTGIPSLRGCTGRSRVNSSVHGPTELTGGRVSHAGI